MAFHKDLNGWLYLLENDKIKCRKIGITNNLEQRIPRFGRDWEIVFVVYDNGHMISILEELAHAYVVMKSRKLRRLVKGEIRHSGFSETFFTNGSPSNKKIYRFVIEARRELRSN